MPFAGGLTGTENGTLLLSLAAAALYLAMLRQPAGLKKAVVKTLAVGLLCVLAYNTGGPWLLVVALGLGAAGDCFLAFDGDRWFLAGLVSFLAAHLAYIALFSSSGIFYLDSGSIWRLILLGLIAIHGAVMARQLWPAAPADLRIPVMVYIAVIITMVAASLFWTPAVIVAGAMLFAFSDTVLAVERFLLGENSSHRRVTGPTVWISYYAAQLVLTLGYVI